MKGEVIIKITAPDKSEEIDVSEGFVLLYSSDGGDAVEHGRTYDRETRPVLIAGALLNLSDQEYKAVIAFVEKERLVKKATAQKPGLTAIKGGKTE